MSNSLYQRFPSNTGPTAVSMASAQNNVYIYPKLRNRDIPFKKFISTAQLFSVRMSAIVKGDLSKYPLFKRQS